MTRARRVLLLNAALGLGVAWFCWAAAHVPWAAGPDGDGGPRDGRGPRFGGGRGPGEGFTPTAVPWTAAPFLLLLALGVALRRQRPRTAFVLGVVGVGGFFASTSFFAPALLALALLVYPMAVAFPVRRWAWLLVLLVPAVVAAHLDEPYLGALDPVLYAELVMAPALAVLPALLVLLRRSRREVERRERAEEVRRSADEERLRMAREVHDVVGHSLSVVTMQAGVALHVLDKQGSAAVPAEVTASLEAIRRTSRDALAELRTTLGMFREAEPRSPVAGLARLDDLVGALGAAGRQVTVTRTDHGDPAPLPTAVDQAAFRIVQEALTNVVRHAGDAAADVRIDHGPDALVVEVSDQGPGTVPAEGNGIRGMRERAAALGGEVVLLPGARRGLVVRARLPLVRSADGAGVAP